MRYGNWISYVICTSPMSIRNSISREQICCVERKWCIYTYTADFKVYFDFVGKENLEAEKMKNRREIEFVLPTGAQFTVAIGSQFPFTDLYLLEEYLERNYLSAEHFKTWLCNYLFQIYVNSDRMMRNHYDTEAIQIEFTIQNKIQLFLT